MTDKKGKVYLIGAGPGDPALLTIKGKECIERANVVVYDYLASPFFLKYADKNADIVYVGKKGGNHTFTQEKINEIIVYNAKQGKNVARLKGGDPFLFGRGGEEAEALIEAGIMYEVVPGVTSAISAPAYAGIPITHRDYTSFVTFITGHEQPGKENSSMQWDLFAKSNATLVFLMGVKNFEHIVTNLISHGKDKNTPVALIRWGTTARQQTIEGSLKDIVKLVEKAEFRPPAIIIVGQVVSLRKKLAWFDKKPLFARKIVVTRARAQASELVNQLNQLGADCIEIPTIKIQAPKDIGPLRQAIENLKIYDWLIFTSVNGVKFFFDNLFEMKRDLRALGHLKFACIGPITKERLSQQGIIADILPRTFQAESIIEAFSSINIKGKNVLLPRAMEARTILPEELIRMGSNVHEVPAYETIIDETKKDSLLHLLKARQIDAVTFTSSSTVLNFISMIGERDLIDLFKNVAIVSIGPITSETIRKFGLKPTVEASPYTITGLIEALLALYSN